MRTRLLDILEHSADLDRTPRATTPSFPVFRQEVEKMLGAADIFINGNRPWDLQVHHEQFFRRVLMQGSLGLGESYMEGWWDVQALDQFFHKLLTAQMQGRLKCPWFLSLAVVKGLLLNLQTKYKAFQNGQYHYDLGNDLYQVMLDERMLYTCAYWADGVRNLEEAQEAKLEVICQKLALKPGQRILDIGCGWGGFVRYATEHYGVRAVGITVSKQQADLAIGRCRGLPIEIRLQDYRDVREKFDHIVSLGMFEHVGQKNYRTYMQMVNACLKDEGLFILHTIGGNWSSFTFEPWMNKYIFPGAGIPSMKQIGAAAEGLLIMEDWENTGPDYDKTLMSWFERFDRSWENLQPRYGHKFYRMWKYYLLSCAGAFRARKQQLWRMVFSKHGVPGGYTTTMAGHYSTRGVIYGKPRTAK